MHPDLFSIGPLTVHSYGTMIVLGFLCGVGLIKFRAKKVNIEAEKCIDLAFGLLISGFLGAKVFHWIIIPSGFIFDMKTLFSEPMEFLKNLGNGFEFFGGIAVGVLYFKWFTRKHQMPALKVLDIITPAIPLAHAFGRCGCFLAGCCYGSPCNLPWAVTFNDPNTLAPRGIAIHPTQLYELILLLLLTVILLLIEPLISSVKGRLVSIYILGYTVIRFTVETFRGDDRGIIPNLNLSGTQVISLIIALGALFWLWLINRIHKNRLTKD